MKHFQILENLCIGLVCDKDLKGEGHLVWRRLVWRGLFWFDYFFLRYVESTKDFLITLTPLEVCIRPLLLTPYMYTMLLQLM